MGRNPLHVRRRSTVDSMPELMIIVYSVPSSYPVSFVSVKNVVLFFINSIMSETKILCGTPVSTFTLMVEGDG